MFYTVPSPLHLPRDLSTTMTDISSQHRNDTANDIIQNMNDNKTNDNMPIDSIMDNQTFKNQIKDITPSPSSYDYFMSSPPPWKSVTPKVHDKDGTSISPTGYIDGESRTATSHDLIDIDDDISLRHKRSSVSSGLSPLSPKDMIYWGDHFNMGICIEGGSSSSRSRPVSTDIITTGNKLSSFTTPCKSFSTVRHVGYRRDREESTDVDEDLKNLIPCFKRCKLKPSLAQFRLQREQKDWVLNGTSLPGSAPCIHSEQLKASWSCTLGKSGEVAEFELAFKSNYPHVPPEIKQKSPNRPLSGINYGDDGRIELPFLQLDNWRPVFDIAFCINKIYTIATNTSDDIVM